MREDMFKVIVERPRRGGGWSRDGRRYRNDPESGGRIGMKRGYNDRKWLNENLAPLQRFLERQKGRPWNDVYSELCANIDRRNAVQAHIHAHLDGMVAVRSRATPAGVEVFTGVFRCDWELLCDAHQRLYVDPETGILCVNDEYFAEQRRLREKRRAEADARALDARQIDTNTMLERIDGIWYRVVYDALPDKAVRITGRDRSTMHYEPRWDVKRREWVALPSDWERRRRSQPVPVYARHKRQVGKREIKRLGLRR